MTELTAKGKNLKELIQEAVEEEYYGIIEDLESNSEDFNKDLNEAAAECDYIAITGYDGSEDVYYILHKANSTEELEEQISSTVYTDGVALAPFLKCVIIKGKVVEANLLFKLEITEK